MAHLFLHVCVVPVTHVGHLQSIHPHVDDLRMQPRLTHALHACGSQLHAHNHKTQGVCVCFERMASNHCATPTSYQLQRSVHRLLVVRRHTLCLVGHHKRVLQRLVLCGNASRALFTITEVPARCKCTACGTRGAFAAPSARTRLVLHLRAWMQPRANIIARAALHMSAPSARFRSTVKPLNT